MTEIQRSGIIKCKDVSGKTPMRLTRFRRWNRRCAAGARTSAPQLAPEARIAASPIDLAGRIYFAEADRATSAALMPSSARP
jgi:hypothetical protein